MRKSLLTLALLSCAAAHAGNDHHPAPAAPLVNLEVLTSRSHAEASARANAIAQQRQGQRQSQTAYGGRGGNGGAGGRGGAGGNGGNAAGGNATGGNATGGNSVSAGGMAAGGMGGASTLNDSSTTKASLDGAYIGNTSNPRQTPPAYAPQASAPLTSCRLIFGFGGSGSSAAVSAGVPLGQDSVCMAGVKHNLMDRHPGKFSEDDRLKVSCEVEGMAELSGCKALAQREAEASRASAAIEDKTQRQASASLQLLP